MGQLLKGKTLLHLEQILSFKGVPYLERAALSRKANKKSQKLFHFAKMVEKDECVPIHLLLQKYRFENNLP